MSVHRFSILSRKELMIINPITRWWLVSSPLPLFLWLQPNDLSPLAVRFCLGIQRSYRTSKFQYRGSDVCCLKCKEFEIYHYYFTYLSLTGNEEVQVNIFPRYLKFLFFKAKYCYYNAMILVVTTIFTFTLKYFTLKKYFTLNFSLGFTAQNVLVIYLGCICWWKAWISE